MKKKQHSPFSQLISTMLFFLNLLVVNLDNEKHNLENKDLENDKLEGSSHFSCLKDCLYKFVECY